MGINRVTLHGNVVADPEIGVKGKGKNKIKYAHFSFAVNSSKKNADFFNCTAFNDVADFLENYVMLEPAVCRAPIPSSAGSLRRL